MSRVPVLPPSAGYDRAAAGYDRKEKYLDSFEQNKLLPLLGSVAGKEILDVGAGTGRLSLPLLAAGARVTALDVSPQMLAVLRRKSGGRIQTAVGDAEALAFPDETFAVVVAAFLIVHLPDPSRFFDEAYRVLCPGGRLVVTNINQKEPPAVETAEGMIKIESYYHRPGKIREQLEELAFAIDQELFIYENDQWINQIIVAVK